MAKDIGSKSLLRFGALKNCLLIQQLKAGFAQKPKQLSERKTFGWTVRIFWKTLSISGLLIETESTFSFFVSTLASQAVLMQRFETRESSAGQKRIFEDDRLWIC